MLRAVSFILGGGPWQAWRRYGVRWRHPGRAPSSCAPIASNEETPAARNRLVFTHIPKAAGSSVNATLSTVMVKCCESTLAYSGASSVYASPQLPLSLLEKHDLKLSQFGIITGHIPFSTARQCFAPATFITVLRDPAELLISNFCSQPDNKTRDDFGLGSFEARVRASPRAEWAIDNLQTRMLCDTPRFGKRAKRSMLESAKYNLQKFYRLVGFQDHLDSFMRGLDALYGLSLGGAVRHHVTGDYSQHVDRDHMEFAREWNWLDMELVEWARVEFAGFPPIEAIGVPQQDASYRKLVLGKNVFIWAP